MSGRREEHRLDAAERELGLAPAFDEERIAATWERIGRSQRRPRRVWSSTGLGLSFAAAAIAAVAIWLASTRGTASLPGPLTSRDRAVSLEAGAVVRVEAPLRGLVLDDGSRVELDAAAQLQVLANDGGLFATFLDRGGARFEVAPNGPRRWTIETSLATVEVIGTAFRVDPGAERLVVEVEHGVVVVRGDRVPGRVVRLTAGERIEVTAEREASAVPSTPPERPIVAPPGAPSGPAVAAVPSVDDAAVAPAPAPVAPVPPGRSTDVAVKAPEAGPPATIVAPVEVAPLSIQEALAESDRLRAAHQPSEAAEVLERALQRYPDDLASGLAAFTLGRLTADVLGEHARAAAAFARVIELDSPSSLVEDAHARRFDALLIAGRRDAAAAALDAYERAYPRARRIAVLRARLERSR